MKFKLYKLKPLFKIAKTSRNPQNFKSTIYSNYPKVKLHSTFSKFNNLSLLVNSWVGGYKWYTITWLQLVPNWMKLEKITFRKLQQNWSELLSLVLFYNQWGLRKPSSACIRITCLEHRLQGLPSSLPDSVAKVDTPSLAFLPSAKVMLMMLDYTLGTTQISLFTYAIITWCHCWFSLLEIFLFLKKPSRAVYLLLVFKSRHSAC